MPKNKKNNGANRGKSGKAKTHTPSHKELLALLQKVKQEFPAYGFLKMHHKLCQSQPTWIIGKDRARNLMKDEGMMIGHEARRFKLVLVGKKGRKGGQQKDQESRKTMTDTLHENPLHNDSIPAAALSKEEGHSQQLSHKAPSDQKSKKLSTSSEKPKESLSSLQGLPPILSPSLSKSASNAPSKKEESHDTDNDQEDQYRLELVNDDEEDMLNNWEDVPTEFLCDITGQLMHEPVVTPEGQVFDKKTLEIWMDQAGQVNPITQSTLLRKDLNVDTELQKRILKWSLEMEQQDNQDTQPSSSPVYRQGVDENLYDFS